MTPFSALSSGFKTSAIRSSVNTLKTFIGILLFSVALPALAAQKILILGDSLSAGYGIDVDKGWVNLLQQKLDAEAGDYEAVNASVSGETTGGGLARLPTLLKKHQPAIVVVELGGNDGLRGHPLNILKSQLTAIIEQSQTAGAQVLLLGMQIPPNYGKRYTDQFEKTFSTLAEKYQLPYVPFFIQDVVLDKDLMQNDGIHPTADGQSLMMERVWGELSVLLKEMQDANSET